MQGQAPTGKARAGRGSGSGVGGLSIASAAAPAAAGAWAAAAAPALSVPPLVAGCGRRIGLPPGRIWAPSTDLSEGTTLHSLGSSLVGFAAAGGAPLPGAALPRWGSRLPVAAVAYPSLCDGRRL